MKKGKKKIATQKFVLSVKNIENEQSKIDKILPELMYRNKKITVGITKEEVIANYGNPISTETNIGNDTVMYTYNNIEGSDFLLLYM